MSLSLQPLLPIWLLVLVVAAAVVAAGLAYRRPSLPALLRSAALVLVAILLGNPVLVTPAQKGRAPRLALVLDASGSMARDDTDGLTRLERARQALDTIADQAGTRWQIDRFSIGAGLTTGHADAAAGDTAYDALAGLADGEDAPVAIVLAGDGADRGEQPPEADLAAARLPVYCMGVGSPAPADNAALRLETASPSAFPGQELQLTAVIAAVGGCVGRQAELVVRSGAGDEVARRTISLERESRIEIAVEVGAQSGPVRWSAELATLPGEAATADNQAIAVVQVVDRPLRLAVIEGQPYWDTSFAVRAWRRDRQMTVAAHFRIGTRTYRAGGDAELSAAALSGVDLIVIGCRAEQAIPVEMQDEIVRLVNAGTGLLLLGVDEGREGPLAALDPLLHARGRSQTVVPIATPAGERLALLPQLQRPLPSVSAGLVSSMRPRTDVLVGDERTPVAVLRRHGGGRVAAVNAEGLWRWSFGKDTTDGEIAARFWRQLAKALVANAGGSLAADRPRYRVGDAAAITAAAETIAVAVTAPDGSESTLALSGGSARLPLAAPGCWRLAVGSDRIEIIAEADVREAVDTARRDDRLARLAGATGGESVDASEAAALAARLARRADLQIDAPRVDPLVPGPWWPPVLVALLAGEWWLRRRRHGVV